MTTTTANIYFSDFFGVPPRLLEEYGAFDVSLISDLPLFVDPFLLFNSTDAVHRGLHDEIIRYMRFLKDVTLGDRLTQPLVDAWFAFPEVRQNWLGFSLSGNKGRGLGLDFARTLHRNFTTVFRNFGEETLTQASHLEKLCLVRDGVGRDTISDFTTNLIKGHLLGYTQDFARQHLAPSQRRLVAVNRVTFNYETRSWVQGRFELPCQGNDFVLLTPRVLLTRDDAWINRPELVTRLHEIAIALPDAVLRAQINDYLIQVVPQGPRVSQREIRAAYASAIERFPQILDYYIRDKEDHGEAARSLAQERVSAMERWFVEQVRELVRDILLPNGFYEIGKTTYEEARERLEFLKDVIQNKGGHRIFYHDGQPIERESDLDILYRLTWFATSSDVSREVNDGRGPADFKISQGAADKTLVEFKLAKNTRLERNLRNQSTVYESASNATHPSLKAILYFSEAELRRVDGILAKLHLVGNPNIVLIDARADNKESASRA